MKIKNENIEVKKLNELKLVGFRVLCPGDQYIKEIPLAAKKLSEELHSIRHVKNATVQIGAFVVDAESPEFDGYWVCVEVDEYEEVPEGMTSLTVPAQQYASLTHVGSNTEIMRKYEMLHEWIATSDYKRITSAWHLEIFQEWENPRTIKVELLDTVE